MFTICRSALLLSAFVWIFHTVDGADQQSGARLKQNIAKPKVTISKQTTCVTRPLTDEGYVDYAGAINERLGKGVTPTNNGNVLFWQALGPRPGGTTIDPKFFQLMKTQVPNEQGDYFLGLEQYLVKVAGIKRDTPRGKSTSG